MKKVGIVIQDPLKEPSVHDTVKLIMEIYDQCLLDPDLSRAAYGCAVGGVSLALNVNLRTASLLVEHALTIREAKDTTDERSRFHNHKSHIRPDE
jgi:hypothetical protein